MGPVIEAARASRRPGRRILAVVVAVGFVGAAGAVVSSVAGGGSQPAVPRPASTSLTRPILTGAGTAIGTFTFTATTYLTDVVGVTRAATIRLPGGTYRLESCSEASPVSIDADSSCPRAVETTIASPQLATVPSATAVAVRSLDGRVASIQGWVKVLVNQAGRWQLYASSGSGGSPVSVSVPPVDPAAAQGEGSMAVDDRRVLAISTPDHQSVGQYLMTMAVRDTDVVGTVHAAQVQLPPGTYKLETCAAAVPADTYAGYACPRFTVAALPNGGVATIPPTYVIATRSLSGRTDHLAGWDSVLVQRGASWAPFATSWQGVVVSGLPVPPVGVADRSQLYGTNLNLQSGTPFDPVLLSLAAVRSELLSFRSIGAQIIRTNMSWAFLEPQPGRWSPAQLGEYDAFFAMTSAMGLRVIVVLGGTPCWAAAMPGDACGTPRSSAYPPRNMSNLVAAVEWMIRRWGRYILGVEPWNEPNTDSAPTGGSCRNRLWGASTYVDLLDATYDGVKAVDPEITVAAGTLAYPDTTYLDCLYKDGIQGHYDVIDVHPYQVEFQGSERTAGPLAPFPLATPAMYSIDRGMEDLRYDMLAHGDASPVWITETGYSTCRIPRSGLCVMPSAQGVWLGQTFRMISRWKFVSVALSYDASDTPGGLDNWLANFGLLTASLNPKPSFGSVAATWSCLHSGRC